MTLRHDKARRFTLAEAGLVAVSDADGKAPTVDPSAYTVAPGLTLGRPFRTLSAGHVSSRYDGEPLAQYISEHLLAEMVSVFQARRDADPVPLDWNHESLPGFWGPGGDPQTSGALGAVVDLMVFDDGERGPGLYVVPAYSERGLAVLEDQKGLLYSSPEFVIGAVYAREARGQKLGDAQLLAVALTPRPAQSATVIDTVQLTESGPSRPAAGDAGQTQEEPMKTLKALIVAGLALAEGQASEPTEDERAQFREMAEKLGLAEQPGPPVDVEPGQAPQAAALGEAERKLLAEAGIEASSPIGALLKMAERVKALQTDTAETKAAALLAESKAVVNGMIAVGKVPPAQRSGAAQLYRENRELFTELYGEVPPHAALDLRTELGHGGDNAGEQPNEDKAVAEVEAYAEKHNLSFSDAMTTLAAEKPQLFAQR